MDNKDILFGALMGSASIPSLERFKLIQQDLLNKVNPPIPFLPFNDGLWRANTPLHSSQQYLPLWFQLYSDEDRDPNRPWTEYKQTPRFLFPYEPLVSVSSGNVIAESTVAKQGGAFRGTVKERWSEKDWDITITGVLFGALEKGNYDNCYPKDDLIFLFEYLRAAKSIEVTNQLLNDLGILRLVIYDYSFPFSKGENVQAYELKCKSDDMFELLISESE
jgi:hypothetical protein